MGINPLAKNKSDQMRIIIFVAYFAVILITVVLSLWNVGFDPSKINWAGLIGDVLISSAITIVAMFMSLADGRIYYHNTDKHPFKKALEDLVSTAWGLIRRGLTFAFTGYAHKEYETRLSEYLLSLLRKVGLQEVKILELNRQELTDLCNKPLIKTFDGIEVGFDTITDVQYVAVEALKNGKYKYDETPAEWFLSGITSQSSDLYKYYAHSAKVRLRNRRLRIVYRLIMLLLVAIIWAGMAVGDDSFGAQSIVKAVMRTFTVIFAIFSGYMAAKEESDGEADELSYKKLFIDRFFSDYRAGVYVPVNITETIKEKLKALDTEIEEVVDEQ